jgi:hypothetical protein
MEIDSSEEHDMNADAWMKSIFECDSNVTMARHRQPWKQFDESSERDRGMQIDFSIESENADCPISMRFPFGSNVTQGIFAFSKQLSPISRTDIGIQIELSNMQFENANAPNIDIRETSSKVTSRTPEDEKLQSDRVSTKYGMRTSSSVPQ